MSPRTPEHERTDPAGPESPSLIRLLALLVKRRRVLIGLPLVAAISALLVSFLLPERYTVEARFTPEKGSRGMSSQLMGLASQFGVDLATMGQDGESLDFYAELLESHELLRSVVLSDYAFATAPDQDTLAGTLIELFEIEADTRDEEVFVAVQTLDELVTVRPDHAAGIIDLEISAPWPELSVLIGRRLLDRVNEFNLERRQTRASAERVFLEARVEEVGEELREAEAELEAFLLENRRYNDPQLRFQEERLQRQVQLRQQLYTALASSLEQARLEEVRNTPVITVLDRPRLPAEQTAPNYLLNVVLGLILGALLAFAVVVGGDVIRYARRSHPGEFAELEAATREAIGGLRGRGARRAKRKSVPS